ncbi:hypothetical protein [Amycolatopsis australiensis]|uniref:Alpha/beta hydrolase family protein n=1 Tax=Amycolatopsis australiensis TaxID=546364 RepID=A0A1K1S985_9PSEU|nr:hypothetical protein [Amycolatopsis australiensis]SFW80631.1 hypothetical protein SAMN04489730_5027 [Amycolatopsis australiensis]
MPAEPEPARSEGPSVVTAGDPSGPKVIVLDPAGAARHDELPATWRPLAERRGIFWCRVPAGGALTEADDLLGDAGPGDPDIAVVAGGPFAAEALQLVERHPGAARQLLLVDPASDAFLPSGDAAKANEAWLAEHDDVVAKLREAGTEVRLAASSTESADDRVPPPLPLGHPDVVAAVRAALGDV